MIRWRSREGGHGEKGTRHMKHGVSCKESKPLTLKSKAGFSASLNQRGRKLTFDCYFVYVWLHCVISHWLDLQVQPTLMLHPHKYMHTHFATTRTFVPRAQVQGTDSNTLQSFPEGPRWSQCSAALSLLENSKVVVFFPFVITKLKL